MFKKPFSFEGRIRRTEYALSFIIGFVALAIAIFLFLLLVSFLSATFPNSGLNISLAIGILFYPVITISLIVFLCAQSAKRCHDIDRSGWYQLIPFYKIILLFQDGFPGPNEYGENPKGLN